MQTVKFSKILINRNKSIFKNLEYFSELVDLYRLYGKYLNDDYQKEVDIIEALIETIERCENYFWIILTKNTNEFVGFVFLDNWVGNKSTAHSAEITTCFEKKYWGNYTKYCAKKFINYCFKKFMLKKLKAVIYPDNFRVINLLKSSGFTKEAELKAETMRNDKLQDVHIYSIIKGENNEI